MKKLYKLNNISNFSQKKKNLIQKFLVKILECYSLSNLNYQ